MDVHSVSIDQSILNDFTVLVRAGISGGCRAWLLDPSSRVAVAYRITFYGKNLLVDQIDYFDLNVPVTGQAGTRRGRGARDGDRAFHVDEGLR